MSYISAGPYSLASLVCTPKLNPPETFVYGHYTKILKRQWSGDSLRRTSQESTSAGPTGPVVECALGALIITSMHGA